MPADIKIHLHCPCLNNAALLPHFFQHYDGLVDTYHVWDRGSTDGSLALLEQHPKVKIHPNTSADAATEALDKAWLNESWKISRGQVQWVILVKIHEHLQHPDLLAYLKSQGQAGITAIKSIGFEMVADQLPSEASSAKLSALLTQGCRSSAFDRLCIFSPDNITETHFSPSQHHAWPLGHVVWPHDPEVLLLSYEARHDAQGLEHVRNLKINARTVPGLGELAHVLPQDYRKDELTIEVSGLFDAPWYLARYPDLLEQHAEPLVHFCHYGWKEGRQPNPYFDTQAYSNEQGDLIAQGINPLLHYIQVGEAADANPSEHFNTKSYRQTHQLAFDESPLRHFLLRHPGDLIPPASEPAINTYGPTISLQTVLTLVGSSIEADQPPDFVSWESFTGVVQRFLPLLPFDEKWYCEQYPDIAAAVANGEMRSAHDHFISNGFFEGREGIPVQAAPIADLDTDASP